MAAIIYGRSFARARHQFTAGALIYRSLNRTLAFSEKQHSLLPSFLFCFHTSRHKQRHLCDPRRPDPVLISWLARRTDRPDNTLCAAIIAFGAHMHLGGATRALIFKMAESRLESTIATYRFTPFKKKKHVQRPDDNARFKDICIEIICKRNLWWMKITTFSMFFFLIN